MRLSSAVSLVLAPALCLSGCGRGAHHAAALHNPAIAPTGALNAGGEPQWSAQLRAGRLRFNAGDGPEVVVTASVVDRGGVGAVWSGALPVASGRAAGSLSLTVRAKPCQDGPTGMGYPLTASVAIGGRRYDGCAAPPGQGLGPRT